MKFSRISTLTLFIAALAGLLAVIVGLYWTTFRHEAPGFIPTPAGQRVPFGLDLSLPTLEGETLRLADLRGPVVLLNVWATWCYPCRAELPAMAALYRRYRANPQRPKGFTIVAVATDSQGREIVAPFAKAHKLPFHILLDVKNSLTVQLALPGIPTSYLLDQQGRIVLREVGQRDWNHPSMHRLLDALLAESTGS
jgi:thiol-disulfide isomerase/thioredoxin